jgi:hypothetical protein
VKVEKLAKIGGKGQNCYPLSPTTGANAGVTVTNKSSGVDFNFTIPPGADGADGDNIFDADGNLTVLGTNSSHNTTVYPFRVSTKSSSSTQVEEGIGTGIEFKVERQDTDNKQGHCGAIRVYGAAGIPGTSDYWNMAFRASLHRKARRVTGLATAEVILHQYFVLPTDVSLKKAARLISMAGHPGPSLSSFLEEGALATCALHTPATTKHS